MGTEAILLDSYGVTAIVHITLFDAKFKHNGRTVLMSFHRYCGPMFEYTDEEPLCPDDAPEWADLWRQFEGWWAAKGKAKYGA